MARLPQHDVALHAVATALRRATTGDAERIAVMCYLADWKASIDLGRTLTEVEWTVGTGGPDITAVQAALEKLPIFRPGGSTFLVDRMVFPYLSDDTAIIVLHVVDKTKDLRWAELVRLASSTWPALKGVGVADLPALAANKAAFERGSA